MTLARCAWLTLLLLAANGASQAAILHVPGQYATIQAAVDAAAGGDEIVVSAGVYQEQVVITRDLTLTGAGQGQTVLLAPVYMPHVTHAFRYNAVVHVEAPAAAVTLRDFTIDGAGRGRSGTCFVGIIYDDVGGRAEHIEIARIHDTPVSYSISGIGFFSYAGFGGEAGLAVDGLSIHDFQKSGLVCFGSGGALDIRNVVVDASGTHSDTAQNGFELLNSTSGTLTNCTAKGCWYGGSPFEGATSVGFLFYFAQAWTAVDCVAELNQSGLYVMASDVDAQGIEVTSYPIRLEYNYGVVAVPATMAVHSVPGFGLPRPAVESPVADKSGLVSTLAMSDSRVSGDGIVNSIGLTAFGGQFLLRLDLQNCAFVKWDVGLHVVEQGDGRVQALARNCLIENNETYGIFANTWQPFDARGNAWGDPSGPHHFITNPGGTGGRVSDHVTYAPWFQGNVVCGPMPLYIAQDDAVGADFVDTLTVRYLGGGSEPIYGFSAELRWDHSKLSAAVADVARPPKGSFATANLFQVMPISGGLRIDAALGGGRQGLDAGELFSVRFKLVGTPDYTEIPVELVVRSLRDSLNREVTGCTANDGLVIADVRAPVVSSLKLFNLSLPHTDVFAKNGDQIRVEATVTDGDPLFGVAGIQGDLPFLLGGVGWHLAADELTGDKAVWLARPASLTPANGPVDYGVTVSDPAGNVASAVNVITADNTPPQAPTGFVAQPGNNRITLRWDDPAGLDAHLREVAVRSNATLDYPYFSGPEPVFPTGPADGTGVYSGLGSDAVLQFPADGSGRAGLYFQAFAMDIVGLTSPAATGSHGRCANYVLADVVGKSDDFYDGVVDIYDLSRLGDAFDLAGPDAGFDAECDVGPVETAAGSAVPRPDGVIDFEDLMVFADAYEAHLHPQAPVATLAVASPALVWKRTTEGLWILGLAAPCPDLKGLRLRLDLPDGVTFTVAAGELLTRQAAPVFLRGGPRGPEVILAVLGRGVGLVGSGELLRLATSRPLAHLTPALAVRDLANAPLPVDLAPEDLPPATAPVFAAHGNYPNPFNPSTTIAFDLPTPLPVRLEVYSLDGRRVASLVARPLAAGRQQIPWLGRDDSGRTVAAGTYIYRLRAGPWTATGKLDLVK